ncbi:MAG: hypothetical protein P8178_06045, partial [Candidatus Thiodiazotropha sp.]
VRIVMMVGMCEIKRTIEADVRAFVLFPMFPPDEANSALSFHASGNPSAQDSATGIIATAMMQSLVHIS